MKILVLTKLIHEAESIQKVLGNKYVVIVTTDIEKPIEYSIVPEA